MIERSLIEIDGRRGEGGGQVLRTALALSQALGRPFHLTNIRGRRPKPGLKRQHLACIQAAGLICGASFEGAEINSGELIFRPGPVRPGDYRIDIGGGGSCTLVAQAILPPLMVTSGPSRITISGGTHVPMAPVFEFFEQTLLPRLRQMGPRLTARLAVHGFAQIGGGLMEITVEPAGPLKGLDLTEAGQVSELTGCIRTFGLAESIAEREAALLRKSELNIGHLEIDHQPPGESGPGNLVLLKSVRTSGVTIASGVGRPGLPAEKVAGQAIDRLLKIIRADVPVDAHLADQLIVPLALAGGGRLLTETPTLHTRTVMEMLPEFAPLKAAASPVNSRSWLIEVAERS